MNFGLGDSQIVEFWPAFPYQGAFFFRTNQHAHLRRRQIAGNVDGYFFQAERLRGREA